MVYRGVTITRIFQRHDRHARADLAASFRLTKGQRESAGESFYVVDGIGVAYPTLKAAKRAVDSRATN